MNKWDVRRANAAIKAAEAQIAGTNFNYKQAVNKIANDEKQFNVYRVELYKKDIEAAKASGKTREMANLQRDMERYKQNRIDEVVYREAIQTEQSNYLEVLNNVVARSAALSGTSLQETAKVAADQPLVSNQERAAYQTQLGTEQQARTAYHAQQAARRADPAATIRTDANALRAAGVSAQQVTTLSTAKAAKQVAREDWDAAQAIFSSSRSAANKAAEKAAYEAFKVARTAESKAGVAAAAAAIAASQAAAVAAQEVTTEVAEAAQAAAQAVTAEVAQAAQDATKEVQEAAIAALWEAESAANNTFDVFRVTAAIRELQAEMNGNDFDYRGASSYEEAIQAINEGQESGMNAVEWSNTFSYDENPQGTDPNRIGPCGERSC